MTINKKKEGFQARWNRAACGMTLFFIPLIIAGGRLATRIVLNLWNMIET